MYTEIKKFKRLNLSEPLEVINLGTGMGYYDFCYDDISIKAFNFALLQQNLYFDYQMLKNYSFALKENCTVCIVLPYFIFCADREENVIKIYERYYYLLPKEVVQLYCSISYEDYMSKEVEVTEEDDSLINPLNNEEMRRQSEEALENWKKQLQIVSFGSGELTPHIKKEMQATKIWLEKILEYCRKMHYKTAIIVPPMSKVLLDKISEKFRKTHYYDVLESLSLTNVQILDYSDDEFFCNPKLYGWPGFLIKDAAKSFTREVIQKLNIMN